MEKDPITLAVKSFSSQLRQQNRDPNQFWEQLIFGDLLSSLFERVYEEIYRSQMARSQAVPQAIKMWKSFKPFRSSKLLFIIENCKYNMKAKWKFAKYTQLT